MPPHVISYFNPSAVGLLLALEAGEPLPLIARRQQRTMEIRARCILIASGGLELTRERAQIPGTRPAGVITPILAHQLLSLGYLPGKCVVIYGHSRYTLATSRRLAASSVVVTHVGLYAELVEIQGFPRLEALEFRRDSQLFDLALDTLSQSWSLLANAHF